MTAALAWVAPAEPHAAICYAVFARRPGVPTREGFAPIDLMRTFAERNDRHKIAAWREVARTALAAYGHGLAAGRLTLLTRINNAVFKVQTENAPGAKKQFALRLHRPGESDDGAIRAELEWLLALRRDTKLLTPRPVADSRGKHVVSVTVPGLRETFQAVLFEWLEGRFQRTSEQTPESAFALGQFIGALHCHAARYALPQGLKRRRLDGNVLRRQVERLAGPDFAWLFTNEHRRLFGLVSDRAQVCFDHQGHDPEHVGLIHADLIWKNYFFHDAGVGAVDFDDCREGPFIYDLAPPLSGYRDEPNYPELREGLVAGYRQWRSLPAQQEASLDRLIAARHLVSLAWLVGRLDQPRLRRQAPLHVAYRSNEMCRLLGLPEI